MIKGYDLIFFQALVGRGSRQAAAVGGGGDAEAIVEQQRGNVLYFIIPNETIVM